MAGDLDGLPAMQRVAFIRKYVEEGHAQGRELVPVPLVDLDYLLGLIDLLLYPDQYSWGVPYDYYRMTSVLVGYYGAKTASAK